MLLRKLLGNIVKFSFKSSKQSVGKKHTAGRNLGLAGIGMNKNVASFSNYLGNERGFLSMGGKVIHFRMLSFLAFTEKSLFKKVGVYILTPS